MLIGKVKKGDTVLVHAAASGVGLAAIQLATFAGAKVFATAGSSQKLDAASAVGASAGFNYKTEDFSKCILKLTEGLTWFCNLFPSQNFKCNRNFKCN